MTSTQVLILAGGEGKRFWPLKTSKPLLKFLGKHLLVHNLERLKTVGFTNVVIVTSPQTNQPISQIQITGLSIKTVIQKEPLGMADAVLSAETLIQNKPLMIMNATDLVEEKFFTVLFKNLTKGTNFIPGRITNTYFPGGYLKLKGKKIESIIEKPGKGNEPSDMMTLVFHGFKKPKEFFSILKKTNSRRDDVYELSLSKYLSDTNFEMIRYHGPWQAIKYPWHILKAMKLLFKEIKSRQDKTAIVSESAIIKGDVVIEAGVKIYENAVIKGPVYIGAGTIVGNGALVRESMIGENCVIGYNTEIARSWVGDDCWFHSNYVGDSVLEKNVSLGAGAILANLRLDEKEITSQVRGEKVNTDTDKLGAVIGENVRIGGNTSIMPGINIGGGTFVGSGLTIYKDIPDNSFVSGNTKLTVTKNKEKPSSSSREKFKKSL